MVLHAEREIILEYLQIYVFISVKIIRHLGSLSQIPNKTKLNHLAKITELLRTIFFP